jgi:hypothetical protein
MSDAMELELKAELAAVPDLRHRVRHLNWFRRSFRRDAALIAKRRGIAIEIDERRLAETFLSWIEAFNRQKPYAALDRRDFSRFAAGLLLRELIKARPVAAKLSGKLGGEEHESSIIDFWPEGFLYTNYCLNVLGAVMQQEFGETLGLAKAAGDLRTWWSYRENVRENPSLAIAFLDELVGGEPNWRLPDRPESRTAMRRATEKLLGS